MATQQLVLLRHAKSDWHSGALSDFDRPLNRRGRQTAPIVGDWFSAKAIHPDRVLCSSAERTRETLKLVSESAHWYDVDVEYDQALYHASLRDLLQIAEPALIDEGTLMLVGHNPGLEMLLLHYFPDVPSFPDGKLMPTGTVAVIEFVEKEPSALLHLQRPDKIR